MKTTDWIQTFTGKSFYPLEPDKNDIDIEDIAHALSYICRFSGHSKTFYSVASHSIIGAKWILNGFLKGITPDGFKRYALAFLLHDASESYLCDIPRPIKSYIPGYKDWEKKLQDMIYDVFSVDIAFDNEIFEDSIRWVDDILLYFEAYFLMKDIRNWKMFDHQTVIAYEKFRFPFGNELEYYIRDKSQFIYHTKNEFLNLFKFLKS